MNCCDEFGDCRQGRDCPVRAVLPREPAKVAQVQPGKRRTCDELGVCQCDGPICTNGSGARGENLEDPDDSDVWFEVVYWGSHLLVGVMTITVVFGVAGYLVSRLGG
jgi:hypothetical protein